MKRLFSIRDNNTRKINAQDYPNKSEAKKARDKLNGGAWGSDESTDRFVVVLGPDHRRYDNSA